MEAGIERDTLTLVIVAEAATAEGAVEVDTAGRARGIIDVRGGTRRVPHRHVQSRDAANAVMSGAGSASTFTTATSERSPVALTSAIEFVPEMVPP